MLAAVVLLVAGTLGCPSSTPKGADPRLVKLSEDLQLFATGDALREKDRASAIKAVTGNDADVEAWVDGLLSGKMSNRFAKDLVVSATSPVKDRHPMHYNNVLKTKSVDGSKVHYLRRPCAAGEAVPVIPWWDEAGETILVCPEAYRPEVKTDDVGRTCGASMLDPSDNDTCGCGPMLVYCLRDKKQRSAFKSDMVEEVQNTVGYVVNKDLPIEEAFTMNASVHSLASEYLYRRARVVSGEDATTLFPIKGYDGTELRPRHEQVPGQHAGVLSTPMMLYASDALRGVMRNYFEYLWCTGVARSNVETEAVLALKKVDLRVGDGWKDLASMPICTDCHAKLDYGMQFFWGYPSSTMGVDFNIANIRHGDGPLYGDSIKDHRGDAPQTPAGFAKLVTTQPEFAACMTKKVVDHVFNGTATNADVNVVTKAFDETHKVKATLKAAMVRYAKRVRKEVKDGPPKAPSMKPEAPPAARTGDQIAVSPALQKLLHRHCRDCHGKDDPLPLSGPTLSERDMAWILDRVAFGAMPKGVEGIDDETRRAFVVESASALFPNEDDRRDAIHFYANMLKAAPTHRFFSAIENVRATVDDDVGGFRPSGTESAVAQSLQAYSPGLALSQAVTAMAACGKAAKERGTDPEKNRAACVEAATRPSVVTTGLP